MITVEGKGGIKASIIAHSKSSVNGKELLTYELENHRYIHSEFMTHRQFSRNAASSRAIPVEKMIELVKENPAFPVYWGKNQAGMQAKEECDELIFNINKGEWLNKEAHWYYALKNATNTSQEFAEAGYHKQIVNRLLEPFQMIKVVVTATEYDNFFYLRNHPDAQPEIAALARCMWEAKQQSTPEVLHPGEWHVPYYEDGYWKPSNQYRGTDGTFSLEQALKISASCCAQVSYRKQDDSLEKAELIFDKLINSKPCHASPVEHQATPMIHPSCVDIDPWKGLHQHKGVTHMDKDGNYWSGNFKSFVQYRQTIPNNVCTHYEGE